MPAPQDLKVEPSRAALLVVDVQDRLAAAMPHDARVACERNIVTLIEAARRLELPVVVSQQYPRGLGETVPAVAAALGTPGLAVTRFDKLEFSCVAAPPWEEIWNEVRRDQWIVAGMEAHVCVYQTVRALCGQGATVHVPADAVCSRTPENRAIGLGLIGQAGGIVTSTEVLVFDVLGRAGTDDFKALSRLLK